MKKLLFISIFAALIAAGCSENPDNESDNGGIGTGDNTEQDGNDNNGGQDGDDEGGSGIVKDLQKYILGRWMCTRIEWRFDESEDGGVFHSENAPFAITAYFASASPESAGVRPHIVSRGDDYELNEGQVIIGYEDRYMVFNADGTVNSEVHTEFLPEYADSEEREEYEPDDEDMTYTLSGDRVVMYDSEGYSLDFHAEMTKDEDGVDCLVFRYTSDSPTEDQPWTMHNLYFKRQ